MTTNPANNTNRNRVEITLLPDVDLDVRRHSFITGFVLSKLGFATSHTKNNETIYTRRFRTIPKN